MYSDSCWKHTKEHSEHTLLRREGCSSYSGSALIKNSSCLSSQRIGCSWKSWPRWEPWHSSCSSSPLSATRRGNGEFVGMGIYINTGAGYVVHPSSPFPPYLLLPSKAKTHILFVNRPTCASFKGVVRNFGHQTSYPSEPVCYLPLDTVLNTFHSSLSIKTVLPTPQYTRGKPIVTQDYLCKCLCW